MKYLTLLLCLTAFSLTGPGYAQNAPKTIAGQVVSLTNTAVVPVYALDFFNISSCDLKFSYDTAVATATGVTIGPGMGGMISTNLSVPGQVNLGWFTSGGITLPDSSVIFNIQFTKSGNGISSIHWLDNGPSCEYNDGNFQPLNDIPASEYYYDGSLVFQSPEAPVTSAPVLSAVSGTALSIPIHITGFQLIGSFCLNLQYDPGVLSYNTFINDSGFPGMEIEGNQAGTVVASGLVPPGDTAVTLSDSSVFFTLVFDYLGGNTGLQWLDTGPSCSYSGALPVYPLLNDIPQSNYYLDGMVTESFLPGPAGTIEGPSLICLELPAATYSVDEISNATGYIWSVPDGATIVSGQNTNSIEVSFPPEVLAGSVSVYGTNNYGNGIPAVLEIAVNSQPEPAGMVTGTWEVCQGQEQIIYTVDPVMYATSYIWLLPDGALITEGINTNTIQVQYGNNSASGNISVFGVNNCGPGTGSAPRWVTVNHPPDILMEPVSPPAIPAGNGTAVFSLQASGTGLTYRWQEYNGSWNNLNDSDVYSGVTSDTLKITNPASDMNGNRYRCVVSGECEPSVMTDGNAVLTVLTPVGNKTISGVEMISVSTNPFSEYILINVNVPAKGNLTIQLLNLLGQPAIGPMDYSGNQGRQNIRINTPGLKPGIYLLYLKLKTENNLTATSFKLVCTPDSQ
ncbi:MAG: T9SS type A sorting domain-containing protein [Dehalogenimonas sp.]